MNMTVTIVINKKAKTYKDITYIYSSEISIRLYERINDKEPIARYETEKIDYMTVKTM